MCEDSQCVIVLIECLFTLRESEKGIRRWHTLYELEVLGHIHKQGWFMWFVSPSSGPKLKQQDYFVFWPKVWRSFTVPSALKQKSYTDLYLLKLMNLIKVGYYKTYLILTSRFWQRNFNILHYFFWVFYSCLNNKTLAFTRHF